MTLNTVGEARAWLLERSPMPTDTDCAALLELIAEARAEGEATRHSDNHIAALKQGAAAQREKDAQLIEAQAVASSSWHVRAPSSKVDLVDTTWNRACHILAAMLRAQP